MFVLLYGNPLLLSYHEFLLFFAVERFSIIMVLMSGPLAVIHYFLSPLLVAHGFVPVLLSNLLFMVGASYYHYLNFLGYDGKTVCLSPLFLSLPKAY